MIKLTNRLIKDFFILLLIFVFINGIIVFFFLFSGNKDVVNNMASLPVFNIEKNDFGVFISFLGTIVGVLLTILTIFYTFEESLKKNRAVKILIKHGKYDEIYINLSDSLIGVFLSLFVISIIYLMRLNLVNPITTIICANITFIAIGFAFLRTFRIIEILKLFQQVITHYREDEQE
ncbi:MAG: hypothetical protein ISS48_02750 [Candidatus Aenigmarchaeota archaeon]|nr:hypothetical protein [Candidatus Aenigmarchaeota archaeon]